MVSFKVSSLKKLIDYLELQTPGSITSTPEFEYLFENCWYDFEGSGVTGMTRGKLRGRMEEVVWEPPILRFQIERHRLTVYGSTRAELYLWELNVDQKIATCEYLKRKQVVPMQPRLNVKPMAEELSLKITDHQPDHRLKWNKDGSVRVLIGKVIPGESIFPATLLNRRKRFRRCLDKLLSSQGWSKIRENVYMSS